MINVRLKTNSKSQLNALPYPSEIQKVWSLKLTKNIGADEYLKQQ
jgi:hypothetical protein